MKKQFRRLLAIFMALTMMVSLLPGNVVLAADTTESSQEIATRAQWVQELTEVFEMSLDENQYPDNYFSDVDETSEYYEAIMLATGFGVIDIEAGHPFNPDGAITREFAVHTLNFCLGYQLDEGETYTFSDSEECVYPDDAQIALNREWVNEIAGEFSPNTVVTTSEIEKMLADAETIVESQNIDENYTSTWDVASGVVEVPSYEDVTVEDDTVTIVDSSVNIKSGDTFVVYQGDIAIPYKAVNVTKSGEITTITTEDVTDYEDAFNEVDAEGVIDSEELTFEALDGTELEVITTEVVEGKARVTKKIKDAKFSKNFKLSGNLSSSINGTFKNIKVKYNIATGSGETFVQIEGDLTMKGSIAATASTSIQLFEVGVPGVGGVTITADLKGEGKLNSTITTHIVAGLSYTKSGGFRTIRSFKENGGSNTSSEATASMGVTVKCGITKMKVISGYVYAKAGVKAQIVDTTWTDGQPRNCKTFLAYMYASYGAEASCKFINYKYEKSVDIYNLDNSPMRVYHHYEDGTQTATCTRGQTFEYFTKYYSSYWGSGWSGFNGSYGLDGEGKPYQVYEYSLSKNEYGDQVATITKYYGNIRNLTVPEQLDGYTVVGIGNGAFRNNSSLYSVVIPDTVLEIKANAFNRCINLSEVILSKKLNNMGDNVFYDCDLLTEIEIPKSLEFCDDNDFADYGGPFNNCSNLKKVIFEDGITKIPARLFSRCDGIEEINIPSTVSTINWRAFLYCNNLKKITIPNTITKIEGYAFKGCTSLQEIKIPDSVTEIGENAFSGCSNISKIELSKNLIKMGNNVFYNCDSLTEIEIPKSLDYCDDNDFADYGGPFNDCDNLKKVKFEEGTNSIASRLFSRCTGLEEIEIPDTVTKVEWRAFLYCKNLNKVTFSNCLTEIEGYAFAGCTSLEKAIIPDTVLEIGENAFKNCGRLSELSLSKSLQKMGNNTFYNCDSLTEIEIPKSLDYCDDNDFADYGGPFNDCDNLKKVTFEKGTETVAARLFSRCTGLEEIELPDTIEKVEWRSFLYCSNLVKITYSANLKEIEGHAFRGCNNLKEIVLPESLTKVGDSVFANCSNLEKAKMPDGLTNIGTSVFENCYSISSVEFPSKITYVPKRMFYECDDLKNITLPNSMTTIREGAFQGSGLTSITLPDATTLIESSAFRNCESLESVTLGKNTQYIWNYAFSGCKSLKKIEIPDTIITLGQHVFDNCEVLEEVSLGNGLTEIPAYAFYQCPKLAQIKLPYRVTTIKDNAFANSTGLVSISIPRNTTSIADNAFSYPEKLTIYGVAGTYAEEYANNKGIKFVNGDIPAEKIVLSETDIILNKNQTKKLILSISPTDFTDEVDWKSSNTSVVTVDASGNIKAVGVGTAFIKVTVGNQSVKCNVEVVQPVTSISLNKSSLTLEALNVYKLNATVYPDNANNKEVIWNSSNPEVAMVDAYGNVTALSKGTTTISVTALDGSNISRTCTVTVKNNAYIAKDVSDMQSEHPYGNNCTDVWSYTLQGAEKLKVIFSSDTEMEEGFDYLYILDAEGNQVGMYTGTESAGKTIEVDGDTVKVKLETDNGGSEYGFKVDKIVAASVETTTPEPTTPKPTEPETTTPEPTTPKPTEPETTMPGTAGDVSDKVDYLCIGNYSVKSDDISEMPEGVTYDAATNTITLNNCNLGVDDYENGFINYYGATPLYIVVKGINTFTASAYEDEDGTKYYIDTAISSHFVSGGNNGIYISGDGTLNINNCYSIIYKEYDEMCQSVLSIDGVTINSNGGGIYSGNGEILINNARVTIENDVSNGYADGIVFDQWIEENDKEFLSIKNSDIIIKNSGWYSLGCATYDFDGEYIYIGVDKAERLITAEELFEDWGDGYLACVDGFNYLLISSKKIDISDQPAEPTTPDPTTPKPTEPEVTTPEPTTPKPTEPEVTTPEPTTPEPTAPETTTQKPTVKPTQKPTQKPTTAMDEYEKWENEERAKVVAAAKKAKVKIKSAKNVKRKKVKLTWKLANYSNYDGYQIMYAQNKKFTKGKKTTSAKWSATSKTIKSLKKKKTYYFKIRAYKYNYIDNKKVYGPWSKVKKVKVKK